MQLEINKMNIPFMKWAQDDNKLSLTIMLSDIKDHKISIREEQILFRASSLNKDYYLNLSLFDLIDSEKSSFKITSRMVDFKLIKKESKEWDYIITNKSDYKKYISYDWDKLEDEIEDNNMESMMQNFQQQQMLQELMSKQNTDCSFEGCNDDNCCHNDSLEEDPNEESQDTISSEVDNVSE